MRTRLVISAFAIAAASTAANAADFGFVENGGNVFAGPYIGVFGGYQAGTIDGKFDGQNNLGLLSYFRGYDNEISHGYKYGGYVGYNIAVDQFIFGIEIGGGGQHLSTKYSENFGTAEYPNIESANSTLNWFAEAKVKSGFSFDSNLVYVTGGISINENTLKMRKYWPENQQDYENTNTYHSLSPIVGAGYEHAFGSGMVLRAEVNYTLPGKANTILGPGWWWGDNLDYTKLDGLVDARMGIGVNF